MSRALNVIGQTAIYGLNGICALGTGLIALLAVATFVGGSGGCGNTIDAARFALFRIAPVGVGVSLILLLLGKRIGFTHPLNRTLFFTTLALWIVGVVSMIAIR